MSYYINSFRPLVWTAFGRRASERFGIPPFVDASGRREPDLAHSHPSITALCRKAWFAPRLHENDIVAYVTVKGAYDGEEPHWRLVAVLKVLKRFESHAAAAQWYRDRREELPRNCMVAGNPTLPRSRTDGKYYYGSRRYKGIDEAYIKTAAKWPVFLVCKALYRELRTPPRFDTQIPTRTPVAMSRKQFVRRLRDMGLGRITAVLPNSNS